MTQSTCLHLECAPIAIVAGRGTKSTSNGLGRTEDAIMLLNNLHKFATLVNGKLQLLKAKTYDEAIKHDGTVFARIPNGLIDWWIIKDQGKERYSADWPVDLIRRSM